MQDIVPTRPEDIVSAISNQSLPNKSTSQEARAAGRFGYDKPTPENSIILLIDHQIGLMAGIRDVTSLAEIKSNVVGLARTAKALNIPVLITSSNAQWQHPARNQSAFPGFAYLSPYRDY